MFTGLEIAFGTARQSYGTGLNIMAMSVLNLGLLHFCSKSISQSVSTKNSSLNIRSTEEDS